MLQQLPKLSVIIFQPCLVMNNLKLIFKYCIFLWLLSFLACTNNKENQTLVEVVIPLPDKVSFSINIQPLFSSNCSSNGCHTGVIPPNRINLDSSNAYKQLMKKGSGYVDTINPPSSAIYASIISVSNPMPPYGKLSDYNVQLVLKWIQQGAKNN